MPCDDCAPLLDERDELRRGVLVWAERFQPGDVYDPEDFRDLEAAMGGTVENRFREIDQLSADLAAANARIVELEKVCTCGEGDACSVPDCSSNPRQATDEQRARRLSEIYDTGDVQVPQGTFNQCEVHGKCVDEDWNDDAGVSHASCLGSVPERILTRLRELERDEAQAERDRLQARVDKALALTPDGKREWHNQGRSGECDVVDVSRLRAALAADTPTRPTRPPRPPACEKCDALWTPGHVCAADTPTTATAEPPADWVGEVSREIRSSYCVCGHARDVHACKFTSVQCVVCGCTEFRDPPVHICGECADCLHDGNKCCGCYDNACCRATAERGEG